MWCWGLNLGLLSHCTDILDCKFLCSFSFRILGPNQWYSGVIPDTSELFLAVSEDCMGFQGSNQGQSCADICPTHCTPVLNVFLINNFSLYVNFILLLLLLKPVYYLFLTESYFLTAEYHQLLSLLDLHYLDWILTLHFQDLWISTSWLPYTFLLGMPCKSSTPGVCTQPWPAKHYSHSLLVSLFSPPLSFLSPSAALMSVSLLSVTKWESGI